MRLTIQGGADAMSAAGTKDGATGEPCSDQFAATGGGVGNGKLRLRCLLGEDFLVSTTRSSSLKINSFGSWFF